MHLGTYSYSFQGQEHDDEVKGKGNSINYKYRMHDPRIGRFFATDPLMHDYSYNSPYAFSENIVISSVELEGMEEVRVFNLNESGHWVEVNKYTDSDLTFNINKYNYMNHGKCTKTVAKTWDGNRRLEYQGKPTNAQINNDLITMPNGGFVQKVGEFCLGIQDGGEEFLMESIQSHAEVAEDPLGVPKMVYNTVASIDARINNLLDVPNTHDAVFGTEHSENDEKAFDESVEQLYMATRSPYQGGKFTGKTVGQAATTVAGVVGGEGLVLTVVRRVGVAQSSSSTSTAFFRNRHGQLTNGKYTVSKEAMKKHLGGYQNKSIFYPTLDAEDAVLQAAEYADANDLWIGDKAKVPVENTNIGTLGDGNPTNYINVYRNSNGTIHGSPGTPRQ